MNFFVIGVIFTLSIYHFIIYLGRKHDLNMLAFSLLCFIVSLIILYENISPQYIKFGDIEIFIIDNLKLILFSISINFFALTILKQERQIVHVVMSIIGNAVLVLIGIIGVSYYLFSRDDELPKMILRIALGIYINIFAVVGTIIIFKYKIYKEFRFVISLVSLFILLLGTIMYIIFASNDVLSDKTYIFNLALAFSILFFSYAITNTFNREHRDLLELKQNLENKVRDRTEELSLAKKNLEIINQEKTDLFINIAHETKTPLTLISHFIDR